MSFCYLLSGLSSEKHINVYHVVKLKRLGKVIGIQINKIFQGSKILI